jgi:hypothetical protein
MAFTGAGTAGGIAGATLGLGLLFDSIETGKEGVSGLSIVFEGIEKCLTLRKIRVFDGRNYPYGNYTIPSFFFPSITGDEVFHDLTIELIPPSGGSMIMDPEYLTLNNPHALKWLLNSMGNEIIIRGNHTNMFTTPDSIRSPISDWETLVSCDLCDWAEGDGEDARPVFDEELTKLRQLIDMCRSIGPIKIIIEEAEFFTMIDTNNCHPPGRLFRAVCSDESTIPKFKESAIKPDAFNMLSEYGFVREVVTPDWWETPVVRGSAYGSTVAASWVELPRDETYLERRIKAPSSRYREMKVPNWNMLSTKKMITISMETSLRERLIIRTRNSKRLTTKDKKRIEYLQKKADQKENGSSQILPPNLLKDGEKNLNIEGDIIII